jgi:hypothetical protein
MDPIVIGETYVFTRRPEYEGEPLDSQVLTVTDIDNGIVEAEGVNGNDEEFGMPHRVRDYSELNTRRQWTARIVERMLTTPTRTMPRFLTTTPTRIMSRMLPYNPTYSTMMNVEGGRRKRRVTRHKLSRKKSRKAKKSRKTRR